MGTAPIGRMGYMDDAYMGPKCTTCGDHQWDHERGGRCLGPNSHFPTLTQKPCKKSCQKFRSVKGSK